MAGCRERGLTHYPQAIVDEARALWAKGMKAAAIALRLGISSDVVVRRWCDEEYRQAYNTRARLKAQGLIPPQPRKGRRRAVITRVVV